MDLWTMCKDREFACAAASLIACLALAFGLAMWELPKDPGVLIAVIFCFMLAFMSYRDLCSRQEALWDELHTEVEKIAEAWTPEMRERCRSKGGTAFDDLDRTLKGVGRSEYERTLIASKVRANLLTVRSSAS